MNFDLCPLPPPRYVLRLWPLWLVVTEVESFQQLLTSPRHRSWNVSTSHFFCYSYSYLHTRHPLDCPERQLIHWASNPGSRQTWACYAIDAFDGEAESMLFSGELPCRPSFPSLPWGDFRRDLQGKFYNSNWRISLQEMLKYGSTEEEESNP